MTPEDHKWFRVEVSDHDGQIVAIEPGMLAGRDIGDIERAKIHEAIGHLQGFAGQERPRCEGCGNEIDPDWCWCGDSIKGHGHTNNHGPIPMGCDCGRAAQETGALCPHGMPLDENVCGPCSEGRPNTVTRTVWTKNSESDPYCVHCGKTWDMHLCDGFSSCPTANR